MIRRIAAFIVLCAALTPLVARPDDDPIKSKLTAAKAAYEAAHSDYRQAVGAWFDKRDEAGRKDGNKKLVDLVKTEREAFEKKGDLPKSAPKALRDQLAAARSKMETGYRDAMKAYTKARMDTEAASAEKELKQFLRPASTLSTTTPGKGALPKITVSLLQKKLNGKATFDDRTGVLTTTYNFTNKKDLKDFVLSDPPPNLVGGGGAVLLQPADSMKHIVKFDTMTLACVIGSKKPQGKLLSTSEDTMVTVHGTQYLAFKSSEGTEQRLELPVAAQFGNATNYRLGLILSESKATLQFGSDQIGHQITKTAAGQLMLHGGESGHAFGHLVISGKVNHDWAAAFFSE